MKNSFDQKLVLNCKGTAIMLKSSIFEARFKTTKDFSVAFQVMEILEMA
jgi:hypothetical protein